MPRRLSLVLVTLLLLPSLGAAQRGRVPFEQGTHCLRLILHQAELQPVESLKGLDAKKTIIIVLGNTEQMPDGLEELVWNGGAVLIATDRAMSRAFFDVQVDGRLLVESGKYRYRGYEECPLIPAVSDPHAIFRGVDLGDTPRGLATNRPSFLNGDLGGKSALPKNAIGSMTIQASFSNGCHLEGQVPDDTRYAFAADVDIKDAGRALVLSDHSVFINDMMLQSDNRNFEFAYNCVDWLSGPNKQRTQVLFLEDGEVVTNFSVPIKELPDVPFPDAQIIIDQLLPAAVNRILPTIEEKDLLNKSILHDVPEAQIPRRLRQGLVLALTIGVAAYALLRFMRNRHRVEAGLPPLAQQKPEQVWSAGTVALPHTAVNGSAWEAARELARQSFGDRDTCIGMKPPRVVVQGDWRRRWRLHQFVRRLWRLAADARPRSLSPSQLTRLAAQAEEVKVALADGSLRLQDQ